MRQGVRLVSAVLLAVTLAIPAHAGAAKLKTRSATNIGSGNQAAVSAVATCPKGTRAVGGGFSLSPLAHNLGTTIQPKLAESRKLGQRQWITTAFVSDPPPADGSATVVTYAYCREGAPKTKEVAAGQPFPSATSTGLATTASCPSGRKATAGGFSLSNVINASGGIFGGVTDSFRAGENAWTALIRTAAGGPTFTLTTFAYCAKGKAPAEVGGSPATAGNGATVAAQSATCSGKKRPGAGGFRQTTTASESISIQESLRAGKGWSVAGVQFGASPTLTALGYCS